MSENEKDFVLNIRDTIIVNIFSSVFLGAVFLFIVKGFTFLNQLATEDTKLLGLIVMVFAVIKLLTMIPYPKLEYKRIEEKIKKNE